MAHLATRVGRVTTTDPFYRIGPPDGTTWPVATRPGRPASSDSQGTASRRKRDVGIASVSQAVEIGRAWNANSSRPIARNPYSRPRNENNRSRPAAARLTSRHTRTRIRTSCGNAALEQPLPGRQTARNRRGVDQFFQYCFCSPEGKCRPLTSTSHEGCPSAGETMKSRLLSEPSPSELRLASSTATYGTCRPRSQASNAAS